MEEHPTSVKQVLRKFLCSKNSVRSNYKITSGDMKGEQNSSHVEFKNRDIEPDNFKSSLECCSGLISNSFATTHNANSVFEMSDSPTAAVQTMVDGNLPENENAKTPRVIIPIVILTDLSKKYVKSRRLI